MLFSIEKLDTTGSKQCHQCHHYHKAITSSNATHQPTSPVWLMKLQYQVPWSVWPFFFVVFLLLMVFVIVGVTFLTLLERRVLGYIHTRRGSIRLGLLVFFSFLEMLLNCLLRSNIFFWFLITWFIIFLLFLVFSFLIGLISVYYVIDSKF